MDVFFARRKGALSSVRGCLSIWSQGKGDEKKIVVFDTQLRVALAFLCMSKHSWSGRTP